jgi:condensin complex protein MksE
MSDLPYLQDLFQKLRTGHHLSPEDEPIFSSVTGNYEAYASQFSLLGLKLVRHPRDFFYFEPDANDAMRETLPRIAVFSFILVDYVANAGKPIEEFLLNNHFLISRLPHFSLDRYASLLRQVDVEDEGDLRQIVKNMERLGWAKFLGDEEFRLLRPFHRIFDKCLELSQKAQSVNTQSDTEK